jgi:hypothetical protein
LISPTPWRQGAIALAAACLAASQSAHGQTSAGTPLSPVYPGRVLETLAAKATPADAERHAAGTNRPDGAGGGAGDDGATLLVTGFRITGNTVFAEGELQPLLAPWVGKRLGTDALLDAAQALRGRYQDAGYFLTQVFVPAQRPEGGIVTLRVVEARLGKARTQVDSQRVDAARVEGYMRLLPEGSAITEQDVERPLLLISDLPGVQLESTLSPGAAPGEADLLVTVKDSPHAIKGDMYVDNQGTSQTGRIRVGADLGLEGPAGLGEAWWLGGIASEGGGVKAVRAAVTLPVGDHGTKATLSPRRIPRAGQPVRRAGRQRPRGRRQPRSPASARPLAQHEPVREYERGGPGRRRPRAGRDPRCASRAPGAQRRCQRRLPRRALERLRQHLQPQPGRRPQRHPQRQPACRRPGGDGPRHERNVRPPRGRFPAAAGAHGHDVIAGLLARTTGVRQPRRLAEVLARRPHRRARLRHWRRGRRRRLPGHAGDSPGLPVLDAVECAGPAQRLRGRRPRARLAQPDRPRHGQPDDLGRVRPGAQPEPPR